jgi:hypothetical protein
MTSVLDNMPLREWLERQYRWLPTCVRLTDRGFAYVAAYEPDPYAPAESVANFGHEPVMIIKRTRAVWRLGRDPIFRPLFEARDERSFTAALAATLPGRDLRHPDHTLPPDLELDVPAVTMDVLPPWLSRQFGWQVIEGRIHDLGYAYSVSTQPDAYHAGDQSAMTYGNGPLIVIKRTGAVWALGANPVEMPIFEARDDESFYAALASVFPGRHYHPPDYTVSTPTWWELENADRTQPVAIDETGLTEATLTDWLRTRYGWAVFDGRIRDVGFAFLVNQQPDAYHLGDYGVAQPDLGPLLVVKRSGAVWTFGTDPRLQPLYGAEDEVMFVRMLSDLLPDRDPTKPDAVVPLGPG